MKVLRVLIAVVLCSSPLLFAQQDRLHLGPVPAACGDLDQSMVVQLDNSQHAIAQPETGKALVYFIQDTGMLLGARGYPTMRFGVDGKWVGANKRDSYFSIAIAPGEHHLCAALQSGLLTGNLNKRRVTLAHFTAEAGKVYFYRTKLTFSDITLEYLDLSPADSDEARYLIETFPLSTAHAKK